MLRDDALHRLLHVARRLGATADLPTLLSAIIDAMRDLLRAERATVFQFDADANELHMTMAHGLGANTEGGGGREIRIPATAGIAGQCATSKQIVNVLDAYADARFNRDVDQSTNFRTRSILSIPLLSFDDELVGVAQVLNKEGGPFTEEDEQIALALGAQAAVALKRVKLIEDHLVRQKLERDLALARRIQQQTFPREIPAVPGFEIHGWSEPADETGGDAYDVIGLEDEQGKARAVLMIADATGHGVGPALSVTQVRSMLRMAVRLGSTLDGLVIHLNDQLTDDLPPGRFVTAWFGDLDAQSATLTTFSAGQAPLLRYHAAEDRFEEFSADAPPLGVLRELDASPSIHFHMQPGDLFAALSDGIYEAADPARKLFGVERVKDVLREHRASPIVEIAAAIRRAVVEFTTSTKRDDDQTGILVRRVE